jgi:hypothetical protein
MRETAGNGVIISCSENLSHFDLPSAFADGFKARHRQHVARAARQQKKEGT